MGKINSMFWLLVLTANMASQANDRTLLPEGAYIKAADGQVIRDPNTGLWQFEVQGPQAPGALSRGVRLILLPNARLQALISDSEKGSDITYRLWARVTKYKGKNYLWVHNYLLLTPSLTDDETKAETDVSDNAPGNRLEIPTSVRKTLSRQRGVRTGRADGSRQGDSYHVLLNRVGYVGSGDNSKMFVFDGFGRSSVPEPAVRLLPSRALEQMERAQARSPGPYRFSIAGIVSTFEGNTYLLVQRAYRVYSHGNFTP